VIKPDEDLRISVLIPARNEEFNLDRALTAILANDFPHYEVIVMDDHSTDATREIVERYKSMDPRVRSAQAPPLPEGWCGK
jgi:chlorobactene glucosyltransferase